MTKFEELRARFPDAQIEYVKTYNRETDDGWDAVPPEGEGWYFVDGDSAKSKWARIMVPLVD